MHEAGNIKTYNNKGHVITSRGIYCLIGPPTIRRNETTYKFYAFFRTFVLPLHGINLKDHEILVLK